ncbi:MAG: VCBS repeat-containing protein [Bacteroidota bacterium]|nr:VCBS repeat-containing protein [Bacteroidota bacterium]
MTYLVSAQFRSMNTLSIVQQYELSATLLHPQFLHYSSKKFVDLLYYDPQEQAMIISKNNGSGVFAEKITIAKLKEPSSVTIGALNTDGLDDIVLVYREQNQIEVLLSNVLDSSYSSRMYTVGYYPEHAAIGDLTNDQIPDIMCYGRLSSGVTLLRGKKNGTFREAHTLFADMPVSDFSIVNLNKDGIADVALFNWLTNEMTFYIGTGNLQFSEQTVLSFGADSVSVICGDFNDDDITDVVVASTQYKTLQVYHGDGLGSYNFSQTLTLSQPANRLTGAAIQTVNSKDIISENIFSDGFSIFLNRGAGSFYEEIVYGIDSTASNLLYGDINGDGFADALILKASQKSYEVIWNGRTEFLTQNESYSFAVGNHPNNILVSDFNDDGRDDILVTNGNSSSISALLSTGKSFGGQVSLETPNNPLTISMYAKSDTSTMLVTSHEQDPKISILTLHKTADVGNSLTGDADVYSIPLPEKPITVLPDLSFSQKGISLYAFMPSATNAIVFYQQVNGPQFLAKSLVPVIPSRIIYSTISDFNFDGKTDLLYVYYDSQAKRNLLGITFNDSTGEYHGKVFTFSLPDTAINRAYLFVDDFNGDNLKDCLVYTSPSNVLRLALGKDDNLRNDFSLIASDVSIRYPEQLQIFDFDNDGIADVLVMNNDSSSLWLLRGKGNGAFYSKEFLANIPKDAVFRCGDFNGDGLTDIVFTNPTGHTVTIIYGKNK